MFQDPYYYNRWFNKLFTEIARGKHRRKLNTRQTL
jgi:hypothetical protein